MSNKLLFAAAIAAVFVAAPALADGDCGSAPIGPAIPSASDLAGKAVEAQRAIVVDAYHQVKAYQALLKPYRDCLAAKESVDKTALADATNSPTPDKAKQDSLIADMKAILDQENATVDAETQVANDFNALHTEECKTDTDPKICPKH